MTNLRILTLDGGGMKGLFSATFMKRFCAQADIDPTKLWQYFDIIVGSSIGAIMGSAYALGETPDKMIDFFRTYGNKIFKSAFGTPMPASQKAIYFAGVMNFPFDGDSFYGAGTYGNQPNAVLQEQLQAVLGADTKMYEFKTNVIFTGVEKIPIADGQEVNFNYRPVLFSNLTFPGYLEGQDYLAWQVVMASGSAPMYLPPTTITGAPTGITYIDGGIYQNNPASLALAIGTAINPTIDNISILSVGCGLGTVGFYDPTSSREGLRVNATDNLEYLTQILDVAGTGSQEAVARQLGILNLYNTKFNEANLAYFRFQTVFDPSIDTELDNSSLAFLDYMQAASQAQYNIDQLKINSFIQRLQIN